MSLPGEEPNQLEKLHADIDQCWRCKTSIPRMVKPIGLKRGEPGPVMIIGQNPGKAEHRAGTAFAGQSGARLNDWLIRCGSDPANPRKNVYFTSVAKCVAPSTESLPLMVKNCRPFLERQLRLIAPRLIISLGAVAFSSLGLVQLPFSSAVCRLYSSQELFLISPFGFNFHYVAWPHPSGLSRWHNLAANKTMLDESFTALATYFRPL